MPTLSGFAAGRPVPAASADAAAKEAKVVMASKRSRRIGLPS